MTGESLDAERARGLLLLLAAEPTLLRPAPPDCTARDIDTRRRNPRHPCLGCGRPACCASVAETQTDGPRWLDLCSPCCYAMVTAADGEAERRRAPLWLS